MVFSLSAKPQGHDLKGIIYKIVNSLGVSDPIASNLVVPAASGTYAGNVSTLVLWDLKSFQTAGTTGKPWVQLEFPKRYIFPSAYSMRGIAPGENGGCFANKWKVYGIYEGDIDVPDYWVALGINDTTEAPYCNKISIYNNCNDFNVGTFTMRRISLEKGFRYIRWVFESSISNCGQMHYFATSALDVYGTLSDKKILKKRVSCRNSNRATLLNIILFNIISVN